MMRFNRKVEFGRMVIVTVMAFAVAALSTPGSAAENQRFYSSTKLVDVAFEEVKAPGNTGTKVYRGMMRGFAGEEATANLKGAQHQKSWTGLFPKDGEAKTFGYDAFTMSDGSFLLISFEGQPSSKSADGNGYGTWILSGGTGRFEGAKGEGKYTYIPINDSSGTKILEGELTLRAATD
jgi:hypothetical protein